MISYEDFKKIDLRVAKILKAEKIEGSDKLVRLEVDLGAEIGVRQIIAGIAQFYETEKLVGREIVVVANLEPRTLRGFESQGMLLAADNEGSPVLLSPDARVSPGSVVK